MDRLHTLSPALSHSFSQINAFTCADKHAADCDSDAVESATSSFAKWAQVANSVGGIAMSGTVGAIADAYGRKWAGGMCFLGYTLASVSSVLAHATVLRQHWKVTLMVGQCVAGMLGSISVSLMVCFALAADVTSEHDRGLVFTVMECALGLGTVVGSYFGGQLSQHSGVTAIFYFAGALSSAGLLYMVAMPETLARRHRVPMSWAKANTCKSMIDLLKTRPATDDATAAAARDGASRSPQYPAYNLRFLMVGFALYYIAVISPLTVGTEYGEQEFGWSRDTVGLFFSLKGLARSLLALLFVPFAHKLIVTDQGEARVAASVSALCGVFYLGTTWHNPYMFTVVNCVLSMVSTLPFGYMRGLYVRSQRDCLSFSISLHACVFAHLPPTRRFSKSAGPEHQGNVLSAIAAVELIASVALTLGMNSVYSSTNSWYAPFVWMVAAALQFLGAVCIAMPKWSTMVQHGAAVLSSGGGGGGGGGCCARCFGQSHNRPRATSRQQSEDRELVNPLLDDSA